MALTSFSETFGKYYTLKVEVFVESQNMVENTSKVYAVASIITGSGYINASASRNWNASLDGQTASGTYAFGNLPSSQNPKEIFRTPTKTIKHNTDGTKSATISCTIAVNLTLGGSKVTNVTASQTVTLPKINRASQIASVTQTLAVNGTNKCTVTINPSVSTYTHKVIYSIGNHTYTDSLTASQTKSEYVIPESWKDAFPSAKSEKMTVTVRTYSGTSQIGGDVTGTCLLTCTGTELPSFTLEVTDPTGINGKIGCFVTGISKIKAAVSSLDFKFGAKVKTIEYTINGVKYTGTNTDVTGASYVPKGSQTVKATVTDTRGYTKTETAVIEAFDYTAPRLSVSVSRYKREGTEYIKDDEGEYAQIWYRADIAQIGSNRVHEVIISYKEQNGTASADISRTESEYTAYVPADTETVYNFTITVKDALEEKKVNKTLSTALTIFDILRGGEGWAFGGVSKKKRTLEVYWPIDMKSGGYSIFQDTEADTERELITKKLDLIPDGNPDAVYLINGGWKGHQFGFGVASCISGFKTIRYWLANGNAYTGHKSATGNITVYKTNGTAI